MAKKLCSALFFLLFLLPQIARSQQSFDVNRQPPLNNQKVHAGLKIFSAPGISYLKISKKINPEVRNRIDTPGFFAYAKLPFHFPVMQTFTQKDHTLQSEIYLLINPFSAHLSVQDPGIYAYTKVEKAAFTLAQNKQKSTPNSTLIAATLLVLWMLFAISYNYSPLYRKSFNRYLTGHSFYVEDVMQRHIRNFTIGFSIFIQHGLSGGIVGYCFLTTLFSPIAHQALITHYAGFAMVGTGKSAFFVWSLLAVLTLEIISVFLLWVFNPRATTVREIFNLYPWPLQLNLMTATLITIFYLPAQIPFFIYLLSGVFVLIFLGSFFVSCFDIGRNLPKNRFWYIAGASGTYVLLMAGIAAWIFLSPMLQEVIKQAASLP